jgi:predicted RNase H-like nuclease (RuvC/YqgF family)
MKNQPNIVESRVQLSNNIEFFVVEKAKDPMANPMDLYYKTDPISFANQVRGGLLPEDIEGFYSTEEEATNAAHDQVEAVFESAKNLEEKKSTVSTKLEKKITQLQKEVDRLLKIAKEDPNQADSSQTQAESYLAKIKEYRQKHSLVEKSKKELKRVDTEQKHSKQKNVKSKSS